MKYNFDEIIERRGTNSVKWDGVKNIWGRDDLLPMRLPILELLMYFRADRKSVV